MEVFHRALQHLSSRSDGDCIDNLSAKVTTTILIMSAVMVSAKQYVGQPIQCWVPAAFTTAMEQYAENYCYVQNTYWIGGADADIPENPSDREAAQLSYYQWVPFMLLGQAALFYAPRVISRLLSALSGINFASLHAMAQDCYTSDPAKAEHTTRFLANYVIAAINLDRCNQWRSNVLQRHRHLCPVIAFLLSKAMYLANAAGQLFLLNSILGNGEGGGLMGVHLLRNIINGKDWSMSGLFPRVTLCDFEVRLLGNVNRYTVQCVLMINMLNEKLYASVWIWTLFVAAVSLISLVYWSYKLCLRRARLRYVMQLVHPWASLDPKLGLVVFTGSNRQFGSFVDKYLGVDGVFLIHCVDSRAGSVLTSQLVNALYAHYAEREGQLEVNINAGCCSDKAANDCDGMIT